MYPFIFYECICSCWHQEQSMRPSANDVLERLSKFRSSLLNKYTLEAPSSVSNVATVFANHIQSLWAITEYPCRSQGDLEVTKRVELTSIQQKHVTRLEIKVRFFKLLCLSNKTSFYLRPLINYHQVMLRPAPFASAKLANGLW